MRPSWPGNASSRPAQREFKLDENLSPSLAAIFLSAGHDAHSITDQQLNGQPDDRVIEVRQRELRALVTLDTDFSNILAYPPSRFSGIHS